MAALSFMMGLTQYRKDSNYPPNIHNAKVVFYSAPNSSSLRSVIRELGSIFGEIAPDEVLGSIFSKFCIGK